MKELSIAVGAYDRTLPLMAGIVGIEGVTAHYSTAPLEQIFARAFDEQAFDVAELSCSNYLYLAATGSSPYVGLPIFPSRAFRHSAVYVRTDRGIRSPRDLAGRLVGVREYSMTAALVARGVLEDDYGLRAQDVRWRYGRADGKDSDPIVRMLPRGVELEPLSGAPTLSDALASGIIDAMIAYKPPVCFTAGSPHIKRLFVDYASVEADYGRRTGILPIMHIIGVRRKLAEEQPDLCRRLCDGFEAARQWAAGRLDEMQAPFTLLPWGAIEAERTRARLSPDYWQYGIAANRAALTALCRYSHAQGLAPRLLEIEELFAASTRDWQPHGTFGQVATK